MEEYTPQTQDEKAEQIKRWFQDNLRIVVSVVIVIAIAGGIYSYSNRGTVADTDSKSEQISEEENSSDIVTEEEDSEEVAEETKSEEAKIAPAASSQETESAYVETAGKGNSMTTLARQATANYLEKNPDSALTKEHKIYIEDYLRKNVAQKGVKVGTSVEFSKDLIQKAIEQSKKLNEKQLKNLEKYSSRVSSL